MDTDDPRHLAVVIADIVDFDVLCGIESVVLVVGLIEAPLRNVLWEPFPGFVCHGWQVLEKAFVEVLEACLQSWFIDLLCCPIVGFSV